MTHEQSAVTLRPFTPEDQEAARALILAGLKEHFGFIDPRYNPDLEDITESYVARGDTFLLAVRGEDILGTGALIRETAATGRIVRMSVAPEARRQGIGRLLVDRLLHAAGQRGFRRVVVETNDDWHDAIRLYRRCGFREYDRRDGEVHLALTLP